MSFASCSRSRHRTARSSARFSTNDLNGYTLVKSSEFRRHRSALEDAFPDFVDDIREILPKKTPLYVAKAYLLALSLIL